MNRLMAIARAAAFLFLLSGSWLPCGASADQNPCNDDVCPPATVQGTPKCTVCMDPNSCDTHGFPVCLQPGGAVGVGTGVGFPAGHIRPAAGSANQGQAHDGRAPAGGFEQGVAPALRLGNIPAINSASVAYSSSTVDSARLVSGNAGDGAAVRDQPFARHGGGEPISSGDTAELAAAQENQDQRPDAGQVHDWARKLVESWKGGDEKAAVQDFFKGIDADAAARGSAAYFDGIARQLFRAMGLDADAAARLMASGSYRRYKEHCKIALQARAGGDIDRERAEFVLALAALLGRPDQHFGWWGLIAAFLAALGVVIVRERRRRARGSSA